MSEDPRNAALSSDVDDPAAIPYFLWDEPMTVEEFRSKLKTSPPEERVRLLGKLLREARDTEAWRFTTPHEVFRLLPWLERHLGRRRDFWKFLIQTWRDMGLIGS